MTKEKIKAIRHKFGLTQKQFAEKLGVSIRTLQHWEQGDRNPNRWVAQKIEEMGK